MATWIVGAVVVLIAAVIIKSMINDKKNGKTCSGCSGCGGGCHGCGSEEKR